MDPSDPQASSPAPSSPAMLEHLRQQADAAGVLSYRDFVAAALYAPGLGYYQRADLDRVGRGRGSDFYTASSLRGGVFGQLVRAAAVSLLDGKSPNDYSLLEIAAEPQGGIFAEIAEPFARLETRHLGESLTPPARAVVFANEWLDAQPFHRFVFRRGAWRELGVKVGTAEISEIELPELSHPAQALLPALPASALEEYHLDISLDAESRLRELAASNWRGALLLADYGYDWPTLIADRPAGTARAYYRHEVNGDLLARPGGQDLTCHVCWDRLENVLRETGFTDVRVERQEAFFMRCAAREIERLTTARAGAFSEVRQTLQELLHPAHLGHKFQILSARRA